METEEAHPVSYTHLIDGNGNKVTATKQITNIDKIAPTVELGTNGGTSVSYTHLDVYKRQAFTIITRSTSRIKIFNACNKQLIKTTRW